jgi:hypothetical protein
MFDRTVNKYWNAMTTAERSASTINVNNLMWDGPSVRIASGGQTGGRDAVTGRLQMYSPNPFQQGSSVSHYDTAAVPNLLMEPAINPGLPLTLDMTRQLMRDIGWFRDTTNDGVRDTITNVGPGSTVVAGSNVVLTWLNSGGFNKNVTIELSTDGGATFPNAVATDIVNTGSFLWTVPNTPTTQARIRVREADFAAPAGTSASNFTISLAPSSAHATVTGRVTNSAGYGVSRALVTFTGTDGVTYTAVSNTFGYYRIDQVRAGATYAAAARAKAYNFDTRTVTVWEDVTGLDFIAR